MRIPLPVSLIREMDAVILKGVGGYTTRAEFIVDAIQERVLDLTVEQEEDSGPPPASPAEPSRGYVAGTSGAHEVAISGISMTALPRPASGAGVSPGGEFAMPEGQALFGLHNRDFPSLWALSRLADLTATVPMPVQAYLTEVSEEAWKFGELLLEIERRFGGKRTALFPTNRAKKKAAEMGFQTFAVGGYRYDDRGKVVTSGPLFEWRVAALIPGGAEGPLIGVTPDGLSLLAAIAGLTIAEPHQAHESAAFLDHLALHAPADWAGFVAVLRAVGRDGASRQGVLDSLSRGWPEWTESELSTNAAGYIARAREWGLVEPKQVKAKYHLTPLGLDQLNGVHP
ncbi:ribbon-helix-helix domain-containing protein [Kribbella sp. NPDC056951]|uniref:ribbon-helix-helix domain-containing protein n=1 Tax=Kribbella sp. NPDC056951 TaxID=3345978 RepID=UPI00364325B1